MTEATPSESKPEDAPAAPPPDAGAPMVPVDGVRSMAEPLAALAAAFHANAEALRKSQEVQADLQRALARADRSEMVVQTTGALNETFRGLTAVQKSLAQRVEDSERESRSGRMFLPVLVILAVAVMGAVTWLVLQYVDSWREQTIGTGDVATRLAEQYKAGLEQGRRDEAVAAEARLAVVEERAKTLEASLASAQAERDAKDRALATALADLLALKTEVAQSRGDALKAKALEDEVERLRRTADANGPEVERLKNELAVARGEAETLRTRLANAMALRGALPEPVAEPAPPPDPASTPPEIDLTGGRDRRALERARTRVNDLLLLSRPSRPDYLQVLSAGAVASDRLLDVKVGRYNPAGRLVNTIVAKEMRVVADRIRRVVEFHFADGSIDRADVRTPFAGGAYSTVVADGESVNSWLTTGLAFVSTR